MTGFISTYRTESCVIAEKYPQRYWKIYTRIFINITLFFLLINITTTSKAYSREYQIALLYSTETEENLSENNNWYKKEFDMLEMMIFKSKFSYKIIFDSDLDIDELENVKVIFAPNMKFASDDVLETIEEFINNGGNFISNWSTGLFDEDGEKRDNNEISEKLGFSISERDMASGYIFHDLLSENPFMNGIPAGTLLKLNTAIGCASAVKSERKLKRLGYWIEPENAKYGFNIYNQESGIVYFQSTGSKILWFGFSTISVSPEPENKKVFDKMIINSLKWLTNEPIVSLSLWPAGYTNSVSISVDVTDKGKYSDRFVAMCKRNKIRVNFFFNQSISKNMIFDHYAEVGDFGILTDQYLKWKNVDILSENLKDEKFYCESKLGRPSETLKPENSFYDEAALIAVEAAGFKIMLIDNQNTSSQPEFVSKDLLLIPVLGYDPDDLIEVNNITDLDLLSKVISNDYRRCSAEGGIYNLRLSSKILKYFDENEIYKYLISDFEYNGSWIASFEDIREWMEMRRNIDLDLTVGEDNLQINVENKNKKIVRNVQIMLSNCSDMSMTADGNNNMGISTLEDGGSIRITIDQLNPGDFRTIEFFKQRDLSFNGTN